MAPRPKDVSRHTPEVWRLALPYSENDWLPPNSAAFAPSNAVASNGADADRSAEEPPIDKTTLNGSGAPPTFADR